MSGVEAVAPYLLAVVLVTIALWYNRRVARKGGPALARAKRQGALLGLLLTAAGSLIMLTALTLALARDEVPLAFLLLVPLAAFVFGVVGSWRRYRGMN